MMYVSAETYAEDMAKMIREVELLREERDRAIMISHELTIENDILHAERCCGDSCPVRARLEAEVENNKRIQRGVQAANQALTEKLGDIQTKLTEAKEKLKDKAKMPEMTSGFVTAAHVSPQPVVAGDFLEEGCRFGWLMYSHSGGGCTKE